jgi:hypothetical protein
MSFPGEALLIKLWETLAEKGVGGLLRPWQIKREGSAHLEIRRAEIVGLAAAERDAEEIRSGRRRLREVSSAYGLPALQAEEPLPQVSSTEFDEARNPVEISARALLADSVRRETNVARAVMYAERELQDDAQPPPAGNIGDDWLFRWRDHAGEVSAEQLQMLWGKLLAGELKSPGSFSLRALEFLRNLSSNEAEEIALLSRFVVKDVIVRSQRKVLEEEGISLGFLLRMQELGVLSGVESLGLSMTYVSSEAARFVLVLCSHGRVLVTTHEDPNKTLVLEIYNLTDVGRQILRLGTFAPEEKYLRRIGEEIKNQGFSVILADYQEVGIDQIQISSEEPL